MNVTCAIKYLFLRAQIPAYVWTRNQCMFWPFEEEAKKKPTGKPTECERFDFFYYLLYAWWWYFISILQSFSLLYTLNEKWNNKKNPQILKRKKKMGKILHFRLWFFLCLMMEINGYHQFSKKKNSNESKRIYKKTKQNIFNTHTHT